MPYCQKTEIKAFDTPFYELPPAIQACFSKDESAAYSIGAPAIKPALIDSKEDSLGQLAKFIDDSQPMRVWVEQSPNLHAAVWFGFSYNGLENQPQFRLPSDRSQSSHSGDSIDGLLPSRLRQVFSALNGVRYDEDDDGGLVSRSELKIVMLKDPSIIAPTAISCHKAVSFFRYPSGETVCSDIDGEAFLLDSSFQIISTQKLDDFLDEYFKSLLEPDFLHRELGRDPMQH